MIKYLLIFLVSCAKIHYTSKGRIPVHVSQKKGNTKAFERRLRIPFMVFGTIPNKKVIEIDRELQNEGLSRASKLVIQEYNSYLDWFYALATLGLYTPKTVVIKGYGE